MGVISHERSNYSLRGVRGVVWHGIACAVFIFALSQTLSCNSVGKFGVSDLEKTGDVRAVLAICYRAQKDNGATGGGNTRNCDSLQDEFIRWQRFDVCKGIYSDDKKHCLCQVYKICKLE